MGRHGSLTDPVEAAAGLTLLILAGIWFLARRDWKAILGVFLGGIVLLIAGMIRDPLWVIKFRSASAVVLDRTMGIDSNIYSFAYLACNQNVTCMWITGRWVQSLSWPRADIIYGATMTDLQRGKHSISSSRWDSFRPFISGRMINYCMLFQSSGSLEHLSSGRNLISSFLFS